MLVEHVREMGENLGEMGKEFKLGRESFDNITTEVESLNTEAATLFAQSKTAIVNLGKRLGELESQYNSPTDDATDAADALSAAENASKPPQRTRGQ